MLETRAGVVSVVLVNFRGAAQTIEAIEHVRLLDWPADRLEIVVVDNGSADGSLEALQAVGEDVIVVDAGANLGFAGGCNLGAASSTGEYLAFLNSDAKPDAAWAAAAVAVFESSPRIGAVASRVLDWDGKNVDFIDAGLTWFGMGYKPYVGFSAAGEGLAPKDVLFGTGSAMFVRREAYVEAGGFDERYFMFFEDVDLGWRLNLLGWRYRYVPESIAYHLHHGSVSKFGAFKETYFLERNALFTLYKNLEQSQLDAVLPAAMALIARRSVARGDLDSTVFDFRNPDGDAEEDMRLKKDTVAGLFAIDQFVEQLPQLDAARAEVQASRRVADATIWPLFGRTDAPAFSGKSFLDGYQNIVEAFPVLDTPKLTRVLIITGDPIGVKMAGPAIRSWNMAAALAEEHDVTLVTMSTLEQIEAPFTLRHVRPGDDRTFAGLEAWADVIVFQGHAMAAFSALQETDKFVVVDIYDPMHLEQLEQGKELPPATWRQQVGDATEVLNQQLGLGDFFLCASDRQRHFYLGQLAALGRINPQNYASDPSLESLIDTVPFGLSSTRPEHKRDVLKGVLPGIGVDDKLILWGGGLYNWFDPKTLIRAVSILSERRPNVRLFFQGTKHPHPGVPEMEIVSQSRELARELGAIDKTVFFNSSWVDYNDRQNYLLEADAGVSTHYSHVETTFSFRTRILDYLWAGLPMVVTDGDSFAELIEREQLGLVVPPEDADALADALESVLFDDELRERSRANVQRVREAFTWEETLKPLLEFARHPHHAPDRATSADRGRTTTAPVAKRGGAKRKQYGLRHDLDRVAHHLKNGGPVVVFRKVVHRLRRP